MQCTKANTLEAMRQATADALFDLCIIDLEMPDSTGFSVIQMLHERMPQCRFLVYTMHEEPWVALKLSQSDMRPYIAGAVSKHCGIDELCTAIYTIREGKEYFSTAFNVMKHKICSMGANQFPELSQQEKAVFVLLAHGKNTLEIAEQMRLSINTIHTYRKRLMIKTGAKNVVDMVHKWKGLI